MKWITCVQQPTKSGRIRYTTNELLPDKKSKSYYDFLKFIYSFPIQRRRNFQDAIDSYKTIFINIETGAWEIVSVETPTYSFDEITQFLEAKLEKESKEENREKSILEKSKSYINSIWNKKKEKSLFVSPQKKQSNSSFTIERKNPYLDKK